MTWKLCYNPTFSTLHYIFNEYEWVFQYIKLVSCLSSLNLLTYRNVNKLLFPILSIFTGTEAKKALHPMCQTQRVKQLAVSFKNHFLQAWHTASSQLNTKACPHCKLFGMFSMFCGCKSTYLCIIQFKSGPHLTLNRKFPGNWNYNWPRSHQFWKSVTSCS